MTTLPPGSVIGSHPAVWLHEGWRLARTPAGACAAPPDLAGTPIAWHEARVPGTVAAAIHGDLDTPGPYDADDWWYRLDFNADLAPNRRHFLRFDGLATLAHVWLNGVPILDSRNMFIAHRVDVTAHLRGANELVIAFRSLDAALATKRPRPRWKTALVAQQNLRWFRTTLLGRIPGWTPAIAPVGPWGPIALETVERVEIQSLNVHARAEGNAGHVKIEAALSLPDGNELHEARLRIGDETYPLNRHPAAACPGMLEAGGRGPITLLGDVTIPDVPLWYPHTHGTPGLLACRLELRVGDDWLDIDCGPIGFKSLALDQADGKVRFIVNGLPVFCRGACWTPLDILGLRAGATALREALEQARDAGVNMLRVGGTMAYESNDFYRLCDELGILVWQDFMFANMDYPFGDAEFRAGAEAEARHQLGRLQRHACIAAYCGGSEIAQQAAMLGLPADKWCGEFFAEALPRLCAEIHPGTPYFPSTPWGGALPFHVATGISHYYGVGAYRRALADVKGARVKFATECLGISNVPDPPALALLGDGNIVPHHPRWKARVPRDSGSSYDFEDVRDHYLKELFGEDPVALRSHDFERYVAVSRVVSGEVMARVFAEWRAPASGCGGGLVWFLRDLWPGAGWGVVDSTGTPKAAYWYLKRAWRARSVHLTDDGLDGHGIHALNESPEALDVRIELRTFRDGKPAAARAQAELRLPARGAVSLQGDALFGHFTDSTNAYRFGAPKYDVVMARMTRADTGEVIAEDFCFPAGMDLAAQRDVALRADAEAQADGRVIVRLESPVFLQAVAIECEGYVPGDNYFHLAPGEAREIAFAPRAPQRAAFEARFSALNAPGLSARASTGSTPRR